MKELLSHHSLASLFFPALLFSLWLIPIAIRVSYRIDAIDRPDKRKVHSREVSRLGGAPMVAALVVSLLLFSDPNRTLTGFLAGVFIVASTGLLDDLFRIPPSLKFFGEIAAAAIFVAMAAQSVPGFGDFLGVGSVRFGVLAPLVTVFCMVGVMNAFNLSDGLDGLAGGLCAIACVFLGIFAFAAHRSLPLAILVALFGAVLGFLRYNAHPAVLFMGDTGSLLLGFTLSAVAVMLVQAGGPGTAYAPTTVAAVVALPIMDTLLVMVRRIRAGKNPFAPDRTHLHHRLLDLGVPHDFVVPVLYLASAAFGLQAWLLRGRPEGLQFAAVLGMGVLIYGPVRFLERSGYRWAGPRAQGAAYRPAGPSEAIASVLSRSVAPVGWAIALGLFLPMFLFDYVATPVSTATLGTVIFVAVLFPWKCGKTRCAVCFGLIYVICVCIVGILHFSPGAPPWIHGYLEVLSAAALVWVLLKMRFCGRTEIFRFSSYETLMIGLSFAVLFVLVPVLGWGEGLRRMALTACLESVSILLAMKLLIRRHSAACHSMFSAALVCLVLLLVAQEILGPVAATSRVSDDRPAVSRPAVDAASDDGSATIDASRPAGPAAAGHAAYGILQIARRSRMDAVASSIPSRTLGLGSVTPVDGFLLPRPPLFRK